MGGRSADLFREALKYIPGGVNSPIRAFKSVDVDPLFIEKGWGSKVTDATVEAARKSFGEPL